MEQNIKIQQLLFQQIQRGKEMKSVNNNEHIYSAYQHYKSREYSQALKQYTLSLRDQTDPWVVISIQTVIAVIHIHKCSYTEAYNIFQQLLPKLKISDFQSALLLIKIHTGLAIIHLLGAQSQPTESHVYQCIQIIRKIPNKAQILFRSILQFLFGFDSFRDMQNLANSLDVEQGYQGNGVLFAAMAMNRQICGQNVQLAYRLQRKAFDIFKRNQQYTMMIVSCKHLLHLSGDLNMPKNTIQKHRSDLNYLMKNCDQVSGVSENTLFRKYEQKIVIATIIVNKLLYFQNNQLCKFNITQDNVSNIWRKKALILKLKKNAIQDVENRDRVNRTLQIIEKNQQNTAGLLQALEKTQLVQQATKQYYSAVVLIQRGIQKIISLTFLTRIVQNYEQKLRLDADLAIQQNSSFISQRKGTRKIQHASVIRRTQKTPKLSKVQLNMERDNAVSFNKIDSRIERYRQSQNVKGYESNHMRKQQDLMKQFEQPLQQRQASPEQVIAILRNGNQSRLKRQRQLEEQREKDYESKYYSNPQHNTKYNSKIDKPSPNKYHQQEQRHIKMQQQYNMVVQNRQRKVVNDSYYRNNSPSNIPKPPKKVNEQQQEQRSHFNPTASRIQSHQIDISYIPKHSNYGSQHSNFTEIQKRRERIDKKQSSNEEKMGTKLQTSVIFSVPQHQHQNYKDYANYLEDKFIKHAVKLCFGGQYAIKRHYSSDGGQQKFFQLDDTFIKWAYQEKKIKKGQSYHLKDIKGILYGKKSQTFQKQCNKSLEPYKCFSLILQKRTLDIYCPKQRDIEFWLPGIYSKAIEYHKKKDQRPYPKWTVGKVIWRRLFIKLIHQYVDPLKKNQRNFKNPLAYAIRQAGRKIPSFKNSVKGSKVSK